MQFLNFQTWVGGDRDGNPNVTSKISKSAVVSLINHLISMYDKDLNNFKDIKNIDDHIIESMIKNFFDNA